ncbi:phosphocarrier protein HPr [Entomoplasma ellychniae]|uniref:Phosphocarrier protein HPr n=2 Tax=Entomoplasmataceae TaxID=33925 RepID=A0A2S5RHJ3_9MOLU|nr:MULTISPECIES: HPr family phosphocarrier protein [Entomoplasmataceae]PPE04668.1 phosphocarrier protein HPr [Entomoplasma ellychniae]PPE06771.1 phosphocarrier protein HPr [Mesoplasma corruscae]
MTQFKAIIIDKVGVHARPSQMIIAEVSKYKSDGKIICRDKEGNLKSIMNVLSMQIKNNDEITVVFTGEDEQAAADGVKQVMINAGLIAG